jgi:FkbM family methyltransferase
MNALTSSIGHWLRKYPRTRRVAKSVYWRARVLAQRGERTVRVGDVTARFGLSTRAEYRRAETLGGERVVLEAVLGNLDGTETVWDVGAGVGTYTCFLANALDTGRVIGFEPEPTNRSRLRTNLERNAPGERWGISAVALWDHDGESTLLSESGEAGGGHHYLSPEGNRRVQTRRGASLVESGLAPPDALKIDVQGGEGKVLRGMGELLGDIETIYLEVHPQKSGRYGTTAEAIEAVLRGAGYSLTGLRATTDGRSDVYFLRANR